jgi:hypothetical protein
MRAGEFNTKEAMIAAWGARICRNLTNAFMISVFTGMALGLFRILDSIATPCSVKA